MTYSEMHGNSNLGHCPTDALWADKSSEVVGALINDGVYVRSACLPCEKSGETFPKQGIRVTCVELLHLICLLIWCAPTSNTHKIQMEEPDLVLMRQYIHTDTPVSLGRWKRLCSVTDTCPDFVNGAILMTNDHRRPAVKWLHLLQVSLHAGGHKSRGLSMLWWAGEKKWNT